MVQPTLLHALAFDFLVQWAAWALSSLLQTEKGFDFTASATYVCIFVYSLVHNDRYDSRSQWMVALGCLWAARLGLFLLYRVLITGSDKRFEQTKRKPGRFFIWWTVQAMWIAVIMLPVVFVCSLVEDDAVVPFPSTPTDFAGLALFTAGFALETVADWQKLSFTLSGERRRHRWISTGLWSMSRHPNYLGEIMVHFGLFVAALSSLHGLLLVAVVSPVFTAFLLLFVSGIPMLEKMAEKRWGKDHEYRRYKQRTAKLIPYVW